MDEGLGTRVLEKSKPVLEAERKAPSKEVRILAHQRPHPRLSSVTRDSPSVPSSVGQLLYLIHPFL